MYGGRSGSSSPSLSFVGNCDLFLVIAVDFRIMNEVVETSEDEVRREKISLVASRLKEGMSDDSCQDS